MIELRPYQRASIEALYRWFGAHDGNPLLVLPTGAGKSVVQAAFVREVLEAWPTQRILLVTHVKELIEQNFLRLAALWPEAPAGIYAAGLNRRDVGHPITVASIQSVYRRAQELGHYDLIIVDEAHLIPPRGEGMYRTFLAAMREINPAIKIIGLTATPYRLGHGQLHEGGDALFTDIAHEVSITELLELGHLAPLTTEPVRARIQTQGVHRRGGEFIASELAEAVDTADAVSAAAEEMLELGADRRAWLVFCAGLRHARHVADALQSRGVGCAVVSGEQPRAERDATIAAYRAGQLRALVNVDVLTTGFDAPQVDLLSFLRPTHSPGLYVQMCGRGMRIAEGKVDCLVLDFAGNIARHGPVDSIRPPRRPGAGQRGGEGPGRKDCPACGTDLHISARWCPHCGYDVPPGHLGKASDALVMAARPVPVPVHGVTYHLHEKRASPPSLRVEYESGLSVYREWVCFEHTGYAKAKAVAWWSRRAPGRPVPQTAAEALEALEAEAIEEPVMLWIRQESKYPEITRHDFAEPERESRVA